MFTLPGYLSVTQSQAKRRESRLVRCVAARVDRSQHLLQLVVLDVADELSSVFCGQATQRARLRVTQSLRRHRFVRTSLHRRTDHVRVFSGADRRRAGHREEGQRVGVLEEEQPAHAELLQPPSRDPVLDSSRTAPVTR